MAFDGLIIRKITQENETNEMNNIGFRPDDYMIWIRALMKNVITLEETYESMV